MHVPERLVLLRFLVGNKFRKNQQIGTRNQIVQPMDGKQVFTFNQKVPCIGHGKFNGRGCR